MTKYILSILIMIGSAVVTNCHAQLALMSNSDEHRFMVSKNGKAIGWFRTLQTQTGNETTLYTESHIVINLLITFTASAKVMNRYVGTILADAMVHRTLNGKTKLKTQVHLTDGRYVISGLKDPVPVNKAIRYTATSLYFREPVDVKEVYSEVYLRLLPLYKVAPSTYSTKLPDGGSMTYTYVRGGVIKVVAETDYGTIEFTRQ